MRTYLDKQRNTSNASLRIYRVYVIHVENFRRERIVNDGHAQCFYCADFAANESVTYRRIYISELRYRHDWPLSYECMFREEKFTLNQWGGLTAQATQTAFKDALKQKQIWRLC
jgi:hypothetical protein